MPLVMYLALNNANVKSPLEGGHNPEKPKVKYRSCITFIREGFFVGFLFFSGEICNFTCWC